ncbi:DUF6759 domain-containing protein [Halpernia sp.]|uniref:DUF6759 domain-containing protein n=1 Tax=Halpernia sp. TaxID=2782209 RepID=UPI003A8D9D81
MKYFLLLSFIIFIFKSCDVYSNPSSYPASSGNSSVYSENKEFNTLMVKDKIDKNKRTAEVISQLINDQPTDKIAALVFDNKTNCNIIVRIYGGKNYTIPVYKNDKNYLIVDKGNYTFTSNFCNSKYNSRKNIVESVTVTLSER